MKPNAFYSLLLSAVFFFIFVPTLSAQNGNAVWTATGEGQKAFIENKGQFYLRKPFGNDSRVLYGYDNSTARIFFRKNGVTFNYTQKSKAENREERERGERFRNEQEFMEAEKKEKAAKLTLDEISYYWEGANENVEVIPEEKTSAYFNYSFYAGGVEQQANYLNGYSKLLYKNLYPGIDVEYTFHPESGIKYALIVHPGADVSQVKMVYSDRSNLDSKGDLHIGTVFGDIIDHAPVTFYAQDHGRGIASQFVKTGRTVSFHLANYDASQTIIIDPWTVNPATLPNSHKVWETETSSAGDVFIYGGDTFIKLIKYNSSGAIQWTYTSPWDSANYWIGGFITHPNGESYMTSGSNGEIRKINTSGGLSWSNNPNSLTSYEYWSLAFNCDLTQLVVGGSRLQFSIPTPIIRGVMININLANGAQSGIAVVGYGSTLSIPPNVQEVSSVCYAPNGNFYFLTLDTVGSINNALSTINFKAPTSYAFDYYIPGYGFGTKQPISAIRANANALYTISGATVHKRSLSNGSVSGTAAIPGGSYTNTFGGRKVNGNGGIDIDASGNVYVGSVNSITKYDANLSVISTVATSFTVYDVDVNNNGEVIACGWSGGTGYVQAINMSAGAQITYTCSLTSPLSVTSSSTNLTCNGVCNGTASVTASGGTAPYTYAWAPSGGSASSASSLCAGTYTCTITDNVGGTTTASFNITQPSAITATSTTTPVNCSVGFGTATVTPSGGVGPYTYSWAPSGGTSATATFSVAGSYSCTITDASGCSTTTVVVVPPGTGPAATLQSSSGNTCFGGTSGSATVSASGGTGPYSYSWTPSGGNAATANNLAAGTYTCTVTDATGCPGTVVVVITQPTAITASATSTPATCGNTNGTATVSASGGTGTLTYSWAPSGGTAATANGLAAGTYTCTVTDGNGCTTTATANVNNSGGPTVTTQSSADVTCFGGTNGTATVSASGTGPFTYSWSPSGGSAATASGLTAGSYTVTVTDANTCATTQIITITEPTQLTASATSTPATCGNSDGSATATPTGGTGAYTYSWAPSGGSSATASNIAAGAYTVTVTDANGCSTTANVSVTSVGGPTVSLQSSTDPLCFGAATGAATVSASGNSPFTYSWSPSGGTAATATGLTAGTYTCTITDAGGCVSTQSVTITEPTQLTASTSTTPATCGNSTGSATVTPTGGTGAYTYLWSNSQTTSSISSVPGGTYSVTITDANGCSTTANAVVANTGAPTVSLQSSGNVTCFGGSNGTATVSATGGTSPYTYSWSPSGGTAATASGLNAGTYTVTVTGNDGCSQTQTVTITQPASAVQLVSASTPENCGGGDGTASVTASGGTPGYTYLWNTSATTATLSNVGAGNYTVVVTDASGCTQSATVTVTGSGTAVADAGTSVTISQGQSTTLNGSGGGTYLWSPPAGLSCVNCQGPTATPTGTTTYTLTVTDTLGCSATDTVTVFVDILCGDLFLPSAFSPNNDNENDVFYVRGKCVDFMQFEIYNRWGELVFSATDPAQGWDGTWRGKKCEAAVFTYVLRATLLDGTEVEKQGSISLVK